MSARSIRLLRTPTKVALRVKKQIARYLENPGTKSPLRATALKAEEKPMASRAQIAAARKNIKKAQAARMGRRRRGGRRRAAAADNPHRRRRRRTVRRKRA